VWSGAVSAIPCLPWPASIGVVWTGWYRRGVCSLGSPNATAVDLVPPAAVAGFAPAQACHYQQAGSRSMALFRGPLAERGFELHAALFTAALNVVGRFPPLALYVCNLVWSIQC